MGATTIWERWDSQLPDGFINPGEMTSFNHHAFGAIADWMHPTVGGLSPLEPGYARIPSPRSPAAVLRRPGATDVAVTSGTHRGEWAVAELTWMPIRCAACAASARERGSRVLVLRRLHRARTLRDEEIVQVLEGRKGCGQGSPLSGGEFRGGVRDDGGGHRVESVGQGERLGGGHDLHVPSVVGPRSTRHETIDLHRGQEVADGGAIEPQEDRQITG